MMRLKRMLLGIIPLLLVTSCGESKSTVTVDTAVLTPLINARHSADNSVRSLKQLYCDADVRSAKAALSDSEEKILQTKSTEEVAAAESTEKVFLSDSESICHQARLRYNRTATSINTVLSQLTLAIQSNANIADDPLFQQELERAITSAFELEQFLEETLARPAFLADLPLLFNAAAVIETMLRTIPQFSAAASQANEAQKAFIICELRSLKLPPFDALGEPLQDSKCAEFLAATR